MKSLSRKGLEKSKELNIILDGRDINQIMWEINFDRGNLYNRGFVSQI